MLAEKIVIGLDDSAASRAAHRWAAGYALATGMGLCAIHVLDWPIGLSATAVKSGIRFCVPQQDVAQPYWRGIHRVFDETSSPKGSVLQFAKETSAMYWCASARMLACWSSAPVNPSGRGPTWRAPSAITASATPPAQWSPFRQCLRTPPPNSPAKTAVMTSVASSPRTK
jgi:hypothetical protein